MEQVNQTNFDANGKPVNHKKKASLAGYLVVGLAAIIGVANMFGNREVMRYHNGFVKASYDEIFFNKWNNLVKVQEKDGATFRDVANDIKNNLLPVLEKWRAKSNEIMPPEDVKEFHAQYIKDIDLEIADGKAIIAMIEKNETKDYLARINEMAATATKVEKNLKAYQEKLVAAHGLKLESNEKNP